MDFNCQIKELPGQPTLYIRTRSAAANLPQVLGPSYGKIMSYLAEQGQQPAGAPYTAYYNLDMQNLDVEIGIPVAGFLPGTDEIEAGELPQRAASCVYRGPYDGMAAGYDALTQWVTEQGHEVTGVAYELYLDDPQTTTPGQMRTEILFPLK